MGADGIVSDARTDADRRALLVELRRGFADAADAAGLHEHVVDVAGERVALRFAGPSMAGPLTRALRHHPAAAGPPTVTIEVWDAATTGRPLPFLVDTLLRLLDRTWLEDRDARGGLRALEDGPVRAAYYGPGLFSVYDAGTRAGVFFVRDAAALPWYEPGAPFRVLLDWALSGGTRQMLHAGAIVTDAGALLLGGAGGSGKSTTALSCLGHPGLRYLSDDYVLVDCAEDVMVHSLYCTAKLKTETDLARFPHLEGSVTNRGAAEGEKPMLFVHEHDPSAIATSAPVRALVFPRYLALEDCTVAPLPPATAFKLLAPSTVQQMPGTGTPALQLIRALTNRVPAFGLGLATDRRTIPAAVERIVSLLR